MSHDRYWSPYPDPGVNWHGYYPTTCIRCPRSPEPNSQYCKECLEANDKKIDEAVHKVPEWIGCQCGAAKVGVDNHSHWCPRFTP